MGERSDANCASVEDKPFLVSDSKGFRLTYPTVTIPVVEYRELCGKAALWDSYSADVERWASGGDE